MSEPYYYRKILNVYATLIFYNTSILLNHNLSCDKLLYFTLLKYCCFFSPKYYLLLSFASLSYYYQLMCAVSFRLEVCSSIYETNKQYVLHVKY